MAGRPILRRTCAQPVLIRVIPENEIPRALRVDFYFYVFFRAGGAEAPLFFVFARYGAARFAGGRGGRCRPSFSLLLMCAPPRCRAEGRKRLLKRRIAAPPLRDGKFKKSF